VLALVLPISVMALTSFQAFPNVNVFNAIYTLDNYRFVFTFPSIQRAILNSALLALGTAAIGTLLAVVLAYFIPHTVLALGLIWFWVTVPVGIYGTIWILLFAYLAAFLPYALRTAVSAFTQVDRSLEEAGRVFGASWLSVMRTIMVPLIVPSLLSGATMIIYYSFRELSASLMLYTAGSEVLATAFWEVFGEGRFTQLYALAMINVAIVMFLVGLANYLVKSTAHKLK
jgi:iron(III) transport system permease protein